MYTKAQMIVVAAALLLTAASGAYADWYLERFDSYATGSQMDGQGGWKGWDNNPAAGATVSSAQALSSPNSVAISAASDLVREWTGLTSGRYEVSVQQYIPSTSTGTSYFILLNQYNDGGPYNWSVQLPFDLGAGTVFDDLGGTTPLSLVKNQWVNIRADIDLDADTVNVYYGGNLLSTHGWRSGADSATEIKAVDLFANGADPVYYDDFRINPLVQPPPGNAISVNIGGDQPQVGSQAAGAYLQGGTTKVANWNDLVANVLTQSGTNLKDSTGAATTLDITATGNRLVHFNASGNGDLNLMTSALGTSVRSPTDPNALRIEITEIPYSTYDLYLYSDDFPNFRWSEDESIVAFVLTDATTGQEIGTYYGYQGSDFRLHQSFVEFSTTDLALAQAEMDASTPENRRLDNYLLVEGLTASNLRIIGYTAQGAIAEMGVNGLQIVDRSSGIVIPEPSTFALAALALVGLGIAGWRRRRSR